MVPKNSVTLSLQSQRIRFPASAAAAQASSPKTSALSKRAPAGTAETGRAKRGRSDRIKIIPHHEPATDCSGWAGCSLHGRRRRKSSSPFTTGWTTFPFSQTPNPSDDTGDQRGRIRGDRHVLGIGSQLAPSRDHGTIDHGDRHAGDHGDRHAGTGVLTGVLIDHVARNARTPSAGSTARAGTGTHEPAGTGTAAGTSATKLAKAWPAAGSSTINLSDTTYTITSQRKLVAAAVFTSWYFGKRRLCAASKLTGSRRSRGRGWIAGELARRTGRGKAKRERFRPRAHDCVSGDDVHGCARPNHEGWPASSVM